MAKAELSKFEQLKAEQERLEKDRQDYLNSLKEEEANILERIQDENTRLEEIRSLRSQIDPEKKVRQKRSTPTTTNGSPREKKNQYTLLQSVLRVLTNATPHGMTQAEITDAILADGYNTSANDDFDKSVYVSGIHAARKQGLLERSEYQDEGNKRLAYFVLTKKGKAEAKNYL